MASSHDPPSLPAKHSEFLSYLKAHPDKPTEKLLQPYHEYDAVLRRIFAQEPTHPAVADNLANILPLYDTSGSADLPVRARDLASEPAEVKEKYLLPLNDEDRRPNGSPAIVPTLAEFQTNFNLFSESSLTDLDWSNVVAAGSAVVTSLLPVPEEYRGSKRGLRQFYHQKFAPAADLDLFLYGLTEEQAVEKIKQIERKIKDSILHETTTIRTKNTVTIASQYPTRHVQIVLRIYKSVAEILTGFDVDCACVAYDGRNVLAAPRAVASFVTQTNQIDLTRRSPSYENRLSKYSHRGFEVFWPQLDRSRIDPTIFERSFPRTLGLARLLVLEKLPRASDRDDYVQQRRLERGRPPLSQQSRYRGKLRGNIKDDWEDEVADWHDEESTSDYHTFTIPYGEKFHARKIERLLYTKDLLLNAEWNNKDREVKLHRHPAFVGDAEYVVEDCCGSCPKPVTPEEIEVWEQESKTYISGPISFIKDDPGRQAIGSFNPITDTDWTEMAYVGNTQRLCHAIIDNDLEAVEEWLAQDGSDPNRRDYTGRTPLHLAAMVSTPAIVQCLVDHGARLIWRLADGRTALHLAAARGSVEIVKILLTKSDENEEAEEARKDRARLGKGEEKAVEAEDEDTEVIEDNAGDADDDHTSFVTGSFVDVKKEEEKAATETDEGMMNEPDIYDINVIAWDSHTSPLHLAIIHGHTDVVEELVSSFGADLLLPIKLLNDWNKSPRAAILPLVLSLRLSPAKAVAMTETLLRLGATPAQADLSGRTPLHYFAASSRTELLDTLMQHDEPGVKRAINHLALGGHQYSPTVETALTAALKTKNVVQVIKLIEAGAATTVQFSEFVKAYKQKWDGENQYYNRQVTEQTFHQHFRQPIITAVETEQPMLAIHMLEKGVDANTLTSGGYLVKDNLLAQSYYNQPQSLLDIVEDKIQNLRKYSGEKESMHAPIPLEEDDQFYLGPYQEGTYQMFVAKEYLRHARERFKADQKNYLEALKKAAPHKQLAEKKKATVEALIHDFEALKAALLAEGAKPFKELYPDIEIVKQNEPQRFKSSDPRGEPFKIEFNLTGVADLTGGKKDEYMKLFEAAWTGDLDTIKSLTLSMRGPNADELPLQMAVSDAKSQFSPFSLAVLRGHLGVAKAIMDIIQAQHKPREQRGREKFTMTTSDDGSEYEDSEDDSSASAPEVRIRGEVIQDQFTIDNIGEAVTKVECNIAPLTVFLQRCDVALFSTNANERNQSNIGLPYRIHNSLANFAISEDNVETLTFLVELAQSLTDAAKDENTSSRSIFGADEEIFQTAMRLGRLQCLTELIKRTGVGLPVDALVKNSGVEVKQKPKTYQGLSIRGKKRGDWVAQSRGIREETPRESHPPLLMAARSGNLASVEWFLSTAPARYYMEFAKTHRHDKRLKRLAQSEQGLEGCINNWLGLRNDLVLHCAVLSPESDESEGLVRYLVKNMPQLVELKSVDGHTPLSLAFASSCVRFAKILVEAGADQTIRDKNGNNLLHLLLCSINGTTRQETEKLQKLLKLLDRRLVPSLLTERSAEDPGALTPISRWMQKAFGSNYNYRHGNYNGDNCNLNFESDINVEILRVLLDFAESTGQKHLELLGGTGNGPVHDAVKFQLPRFLEAMLDRRPDLLAQENATGSTPFELANDALVAEFTRDPPSIPSDNENYYGRQNHVDQQSAVNRAVDTFADDSGKDKRSERQIIYDLCRKRVTGSAGVKRKLVSLFEANEVAKRLAMRKTGGSSGRRGHRFRPPGGQGLGRRDRGQGGVEDGRDEVSMWAI